jgi:hypothetical protein
MVFHECISPWIDRGQSNMGCEEAKTVGNIVPIASYCIMMSKWILTNSGEDL